MTGPYAFFKGKLKVGDRVRDVNRFEGIVDQITEDGFGFTEDKPTLENSFFRYWDQPGTLELLTPSPRVVTLQNLQKGDEVQEKGGFIRTVIAKIEPNVVILSDWYRENETRPFITLHEIKLSYGCTVTSEQMELAGWSVYPPVQPSPSPAETDETPMDEGFKAMLARFLDEYGAGLKKLNDKLDEALGKTVLPSTAETEEEWWNGKDYHSVAAGYEWSDVCDMPKIVAEAMKRGEEKVWKEAKDIIRDRVFQMDCGSAEEHQMNLFGKVDAKLKALSKPARAGEK